MSEQKLYFTTKVIRESQIQKETEGVSHVSRGRDFLEGMNWDGTGGLVRGTTREYRGNYVIQVP